MRWGGGKRREENKDLYIFILLFMEILCTSVSGGGRETEGEVERMILKGYGCILVVFCYLFIFI